MEELDVNKYLLSDNLFELFRTQLKKDFESSGVNGDFAEKLPCGFELLKSSILIEMRPIIKSNSSILSSLLYRIDISELQLQNYSKNNPELMFEEVLAELIIKRTLQKVILKKTFSK